MSHFQDCFTNEFTKDDNENSSCDNISGYFLKKL